MSRNNTIAKINQVIDYIERNIRQEITLDEISNYAVLSKFHLGRIFNAITDLPLMNYVRCRKLAYSIADLLHTDLRIIDIAQEYNFTFEQNYIRSFRQTFGISPSKFRKQKPAIEIMPKINPNCMVPIGEDGVVFNPEFVLKPHFKLVGTRYRIDLADNMKNSAVTRIANDFYFNQTVLVKNKKNPQVFIGYIEIIPGVHTHRYYITSTEVTSAEHIPYNMEVIDIPTNLYAVFKYISFHSAQVTTIDEIVDIYKYIMQIWLQKSGYKFTGVYWFERVDMHMSRDDYSEFEIWFPIVE